MMNSAPLAISARERQINTMSTTMKNFVSKMMNIDEMGDFDDREGGIVLRTYSFSSRLGRSFLFDSSF